MGLFSLIKNLISGAKNLEEQAESFVADVKKESADLSNKLEAGVAKAKAVTKEVEAKAEVIEKTIVVKRAKKETATKAAAPKKAATKKTK